MITMAVKNAQKTNNNTAPKNNEICPTVSIILIRPLGRLLWNHRHVSLILSSLCHRRVLNVAYSIGQGLVSPYAPQ